MKKEMNAETPRTEREMHLLSPSFLGVSAFILN